MDIHTDALVVGGGLGGVAAAIALAKAGSSVVLTEEYDWLGGQLTSQAVPPDEHSWVERFGITAGYRALRDGIRDYYRNHYPLTGRARAWDELNPGAGWVSRLCHEPRVAVAVIEAMLAPYRGSGRLRVLQPYRPVGADTEGDLVTAVTFAHRDTGERTTVSARFVLDATETGELLPLTGTEYVTGFESQADTGEPSAPEEAQPQNMQAISVCFAMDHVDGDHTIERPKTYDYWRAYQPEFWGDRLLSWSAPIPRTLEPVERTFTPNPEGDPMAVLGDQQRFGGDLDLWSFRRIAARGLFEDGAYASDITLVNWPMIDYFDGSIIDVPDADRHVEAARELSRSALYWMQTEAPRPDGGTGYPGLRLRGDVTGGADGLAQAPYIRESRRIRALYTVPEQDLSLAVRGDKGAVRYEDSVGVGMYRIDLHPSTGGDNYIDVGCSPFEIPLGALIPRRMRNLVAAAKNIGTTHISNGAYRLHPVEWNIGEAAGTLVAFCMERSATPYAVREKDDLLSEYQSRLERSGVELHWPDGVHGY
ncbi:FAD-dependent oxidoreductase [Actinoallomurus rhizosphaericola]|uniref:FAD-dependent oxidoreductase n=1 Tax=Actinoallomurus rhizosphaericola TaxID=2952536 RepID=UPI00209201EA|nr:FAD-dependent oxidoreductase [Actinoallomurus rhizosphaericola]MCO5998014.1 FAD-dependent oxidoreductase [Actinoallomurus rhizosphaericola]